jgi:orotate phosphoribosyltransferase
MNNQKVIELLARRSARIGVFTLASGRQSNFYIDARLTTMSPEGLLAIGTLGLEVLTAANWNVQAVGGLTLGADPISYAISYTSNGTSNPLRAFTVRKEAKGHGTRKLIEGPMREGDRVAIIEDVITTGGSALQATKAVTEAGASIAGVLALVDREEGGRGAIEDAGYSVLSLTTASEILDYLQATKVD